MVIAFTVARYNVGYYYIEVGSEQQMSEYTVQASEERGPGSQQLGTDVDPF